MLDLCEMNGIRCGLTATDEGAQQKYPDTEMSDERYGHRDSVHAVIVSGWRHPLSATINVIDVGVKCSELWPRRGQS